MVRLPRWRPTQSGFLIFNMTIAIDIRALAGGLQGGIQEYILQLLPELVNLDRSIKFKLFFNAHRQRISAQSQWLKQSNVELVQTNLSNQWLMARTGWFARPFLDELAGGADVWFSPHFFPVALSKCCHLVTTFHDLSWVRHPEFFSWRQRLWHHWLVDPHTLAQRAKQIIAVSHSTRSDLVELYKLPAEKISMIHSGIGADFFQPVSAVELVAVQKKYKLPKDFFLFLGTLEPRKNVAGVITAFLRLKKAPVVPESVELVLAGGAGWQHDRLIKLAQQSFWSNQVHFIGAPDSVDRPALYQLARVFVYPSWFEGFGFPPLEAMAGGTPVITSHNSSFPETSGPAALMINPSSISQLSDAMHQLWNDENLRQQLILAGKIQSTKFNWQKTAEETLNVLTEP